MDAGLIPSAAPVFEGTAAAGLLLVGQAPGVTEQETRRPFSGRAGRELDRWMIRAGFRSSADFRRSTYIAALARCFPGRAPGGGDLRPPPAMVANCAPWLESELELLRPRVILAVGQMAITRFLGPGRLEDRVGSTFGSHPAVIPLPHPSGQSRWLNQAVNRARLDRALALVSNAREELCSTAT